MQLYAYLIARTTIANDIDIDHTSVETSHVCYKFWLRIRCWIDDGSYGDIAIRYGISLNNPTMYIVVSLKMVPHDSSVNIIKREGLCVNKDSKFYVEGRKESPPDEAYKSWYTMQLWKLDMVCQLTYNSHDFQLIALHKINWDEILPWW